MLAEDLTQRTTKVPQTAFACAQHLLHALWPFTCGGLGEGPSLAQSQFALSHMGAWVHEQTLVPCNIKEQP